MLLTFDWGQIMNASTDTALLDKSSTSDEDEQGKETPPPEDESGEQTTAKPKLEIDFLALDGEPIAKMGVAVRWSGGELIARTDNEGAISPVEAPPGETLSIAVQRFDGSYKKIGECCMPSSDGVLTAVSPNIVVETTTEKHEGKPGKAEENIPKPEASDLGDLKPASPNEASEAESTANKPESPAPENPSTSSEQPASKPAEQEKHQGTSQGSGNKPKKTSEPKKPNAKTQPTAKQQSDKPPQHISGREPEKPKLEKGRDENGNPLAVITQKALDWWNSWRMPTFNLWGAGGSGSSGGDVGAQGGSGTTPATPVAVNTEMVKKVEALLTFAREQTEYDYKASGEGTAAVLASMGKGTFKHKKGEKFSKDSQGLCYTYVKVALARTKVVDGMLDGVSASKAGPSLISKGFRDVTAEVPDGRWAAAGDVIVYEWTDAIWEKRKKKDANTPNHGHIDIRDYEFYISDFIPKFEPKNYLGRPGWNHYQNIRIYRKVFDPLPTQRIRVFLRCIREFECQAERDDSKRYQMLNAPLPTGERRFSSYKTHPWEGQGKPFKGSTAAGAYQIVQGTWKEVFDSGLIEAKGDRFSPAIQDRIAVMKLEDRAALHLVRTGNIQDAIGKLTTEWTSLPGGKENAHRLTADKKPMDMAYFKSLFDMYLEEERKKG